MLMLRFLANQHRLIAFFRVDVGPFGGFRKLADQDMLGLIAFRPMCMSALAFGHPAEIGFHRPIALRRVGVGALSLRLSADIGFHGFVAGGSMLVPLGFVGTDQAI